MSTAPEQFVIYKDASGEWRWTLYATNSKKIANGGEGYENKADCIHGFRLVATVVTDAGVWNHETKEWES